MAEDEDAVAQLLDLARDVFDTPVAALERAPTGDGSPLLEQTSSALDPHATVQLLADTDLTATPSVDVLRPDGTRAGRLLGVHTDPGRRDGRLTPRQAEALKVVAALVAGVLHHRDRRSCEHRDRLASLDALLNGRGRVTVLQPVVDLRSGAVVGAEALSRFTGPDGYARRPSEVFADARSAGVGVRMEQAALVSALELLPAMPAGTYLSVNTSAEALLDEGTRAVLHASQPGRLVVEVTEHDRVSDYGALAAATAELRADGLRLAVDDTGAGFASLQHVLHLAPDVVKMDTTFVRGVDTDLARRAVARALVGFAHETGSTLIAEGVQRGGELAVLRELGVHCGQGFLLGRPGPLPLPLSVDPALVPGDEWPAWSTWPTEPTAVVEPPAS